MYVTKERFQNKRVGLLSQALATAVLVLSSFTTMKLPWWAASILSAIGVTLLLFTWHHYKRAKEAYRENAPYEQACNELKEVLSSLKTGMYIHLGTNVVFSIGYMSKKDTSNFMIAAMPHAAIIKSATNIGEHVSGMLIYNRDEPCVFSQSIGIHLESTEDGIFPIFRIKDPLPIAAEFRMPLDEVTALTGHLRECTEYVRQP